MLTISHPQAGPFNGNLHLNIEFKNGQPSIVSHEFKQVNIDTVRFDQDKPEIFNSHLLAAVRGIDRSTSAIDALVQDLRALAGSAPDRFFSTLAPKLMGRERRHMAQRRIDIYPLRPDLALEHSVKLVDGWFLGTNIKNDQKVQFLKIACEIKGLKPVPIQNYTGAH